MVEFIHVTNSQMSKMLLRKGRVWKLFTIHTYAGLLKTLCLIFMLDPAELVHGLHIF